MHWWIVEDALRDRKGHWVEYLTTFKDGLYEYGDEVRFLCDQTAEPWVLERFAASAVLPPSIWHRISDNAPRWKRLLRIPLHAWATKKAIKKFLTKQNLPDIIFVPTVLVHHLLGWWLLQKSILKKTNCRLLLFFPNAPVRYNLETQCAELADDPTSRLFRWLIRRFENEVRKGRVILGAETHKMCNALRTVTGVQFIYLPHPVSALNHTPGKRLNDGNKSRHLVFGSYGAARFEKGSDILQEAINIHLKAYPETKSHFVVQWLTDFDNERGKTVHKSRWLKDDARVRFITEYFAEGGYERQLGNTNIMLLPYREPYRYRVSRVAIEAMMYGMPIIATDCTTLQEQAKEFGAVISCDQDNPQSLATAIRQAELKYDQLIEKVNKKREVLFGHFSVNNFRSIISAKLIDEMPSSYV